MKNKKRLYITIISIILLLVMLVPIHSMAEIIEWLTPGGDGGGVTYEDSETGETLTKDQVYRAGNGKLYRVYDNASGERWYIDDSGNKIYIEGGGSSSGGNGSTTDPEIESNMVYDDHYGLIEEFYNPKTGERWFFLLVQQIYITSDYVDGYIRRIYINKASGKKWYYDENDERVYIGSGTTDPDDPDRPDRPTRPTIDIETGKQSWGYGEGGRVEWGYEENGELYGNFTFRKDGKDFTTTSLWYNYKEEGGSSEQIINGPTFCVNIDKRLVDTRYVQTVFNADNSRRVTWSDNREYIINNQNIAYILAFAPGDSLEGKMGIVQTAIWNSGFKGNEYDIQGKTDEEIIELVKKQRLLENEEGDKYEEIKIGEADKDEDIEDTNVWDEEDYEEKIRSYFNKQLVEDAEKYKKFNHDNDKNNDGIVDFESSDETIYPRTGSKDPNALRVLVDQDNKKFTVGKYKIRYTEYGPNQKDAETLNHDKDDPSDTTKKFSYISKITLKNQDGVEMPYNRIISARTGEIISNRPDYKYPYSGEEFYIEYDFDPDCYTTEVHLEVEFKYLAQCYAEFREWRNVGAGLKEKETGVQKEEDYVKIDDVVYIRYKQEDNWGEWMAQNGCGATTLATIASAYAGRKITPLDIQSKTGYALTIDVMMQALADTLGQSVMETFDYPTYRQVETSNGDIAIALEDAVEEIQRSLEEHRPVLTLIAPNDGTDGTEEELFCDKIHYVTLLGLDNDGNLLLANPKTGYAEEYDIEYYEEPEEDDDFFGDDFDDEDDVGEHSRKVIKNFMWRYMYVNGGADFNISTKGPRGYVPMRDAPPQGDMEGAYYEEDLEPEEIQPLMQVSTEITDMGKQHISELTDMYESYGNDQLAYAIWSKATLNNKLGTTPINVRMDIGGIVFMDVPGEKDTDLLNVNGVYDEGTDILLPDIEVTLYDEQGNVVEMLPNLTTDDGRPITNPTITNSKGEYMFKGLCAQKRYYLKYKLSSYYTKDGTDYLVNGQYLENTIYTQPTVDSFNIDLKSNRATLLDIDRTNYNAVFETINSSPNNYRVQNRIFNSIGEYNKTYNIFDQTYPVGQQEKNEMASLQKQITEKIRNYVNSYKKYPDDLAKRSIYNQVRNDNRNISEVENKIQYLVDLAVTATTGKGSKIDIYPIKKQFAINDEENTSSTKVLNTTYIAIYPGQRHINCGTIEREKFDLKLSKDIYQIKLVINGKEHLYTCNRRQDEAVDVEVRGSDVLFNSQSDRYGVSNHNAYERDLRECDIRFINYSLEQSDNPDNNVNYDRRLRVFVTYRIRVTNQSNQAITGYVTELADYYDEDYEYMSSNIVTHNSVTLESGNQLRWNNDTTNHKLTTADTNLSSIGLEVSDYFDIYSEFEVKTDALKRLLAEEKSTKENYAEIMGYKTYYTNQRRFKQTGDVINEAGAPAGLVDRDSRPGDFAVTKEVKDFVEYSYTDAFKNKDGETRTKESLNIFQDDADKAPGLNLKLLTEIRVLKGNVWEDKIVKDTLEKNNIRIGDGKNNDGQPITDLKVELIDIENITGSPDKTTYSDTYGPNLNIADIYNRGNLSNPSDISEQGFKPAVTYTNDNGDYEFNGYVPGDYLLRFIYGEKELLTTNKNGGKVYNGQDYKSTLYTESDYSAIKEDGTKRYWYHELRNQPNGRTSDALDNFTRRNEINEYYVEMDNKKADVLNYIQNRKSENVNELEKRTRLWADTEKMVMEVEYTEIEAEYERGKYITYQTYVVENVDFGIVERPRQELTLTKDIENVRFITNSGQTIFDANEQSANLSWIKPIKNITGRYNRDTDRNGLINMTIDENLMHGGTIKILYKIIIENTGEKDYVNADGTVDQIFYKTGQVHGNLVENQATLVVDYIENNLKFNTNTSDTDSLDNIDKGYTFSNGKKYNSDWERIKGEDNRGKKDDNKDEEGNEKFDTILREKLDPNVVTKANEFNAIVKSKGELLKNLKPAEKRATHDNEKDITNVVDIVGNIKPETDIKLNTYGEYAVTDLFLTKVLDTGDKAGDNFEYSNALEIIGTRNLAGRRCYNYIDKSIYQDQARKDGKDQINDRKDGKWNMIFSVPGDYDPTLASSRADHMNEVATQTDYDYSERITINVPFGAENVVIIIVVIIACIVVLAIGIIIIKKKVLNKKRNIEGNEE